MEIDTELLQNRLHSSSAVFSASGHREQTEMYISQYRVTAMCPLSLKCPQSLPTPLKLNPTFPSGSHGILTATIPLYSNSKHMEVPQIQNWRSSLVYWTILCIVMICRYSVNRLRVANFLTELNAARQSQDLGMPPAHNFGAGPSSEISYGPQVIHMTRMADFGLLDNPMYSSGR